MKKQVILLGGGGHAKVLAEALRLSGVSIKGYADTQEKDLVSGGKRLKYLGRDEAFVKIYRKEKVLLVNGVGSVGDTERRAAIFEKFRRQGYRFASVKHPKAIVASDAEIGEGAQIMAGAVIQPGCVIGANAVINTRASVDHDCRIGEHAFIAPGVTLSGGVTVGARSHVGTGATVIQGQVLGENCFVNARSVIRNSMKDHEVYRETERVGDGAPVRVES